MPKPSTHLTPAERTLIRSFGWDNLLRADGADRKVADGLVRRGYLRNLSPGFYRLTTDGTAAAFAK